MNHGPAEDKTATGKNTAEQSFKDKKILVMGLGLLGGGVETVKFLAQNKANLTVTDLRSKLQLKAVLRTLKRIKNILYVLGRHARKDFINSDLIVKNPGVKPDSPFLEIARKHHTPITSDMGIFFKNYPGHIIGVTGTRGKSTTAYLIWKFLKAGLDQKKSPKVFLGGNIGKSALEFIPLVKNRDWVVLELSSFQLHDLALEKQSPEIAVLTNIFPDHLNWHKNFVDYLRSKSCIFSFQKKDDLIFINGEDKICQRAVKGAKAKIILVTPRLPKKLEKIVIQNLGQHHKNSVALARAVAKHFDIGDQKVLKVLKKFRGLGGRQEIVKTVGGVTWINDTTSTMPEATIAALNRFSILAEKTSGRLILIAGGQDKNLDFKKMARAIDKSVSVLILLPGKATEKLKKSLEKTGFKEKNMVEIDSMLEAVTKAKNLAQKGDLIIFSPGATSFGLFNNEFDRGRQFLNSIKRLTKHP